MNNKPIAIENNIPLPKSETRNVQLYPWLTMVPGDSFVVIGKIAASAARGSFRRYQTMGKIPADLKAVQRTLPMQGGPEYDRIRLWLEKR
jgi:hypothetical protein